MSLCNTQNSSEWVLERNDSVGILCSVVRLLCFIIQQHGKCCRGVALFSSCEQRIVALLCPYVNVSCGTRVCLAARFIICFVKVVAGKTADICCLLAHINPAVARTLLVTLRR